MKNVLKMPNLAPFAMLFSELMVLRMMLLRFFFKNTEVSELHM